MKTGKNKSKIESDELKEIFVQVGQVVPLIMGRLKHPEVAREIIRQRTNDRIDPYIEGAPVDYSFRKVYSLSELENGTPREYRVGIPRKAASGKYISSSLWANYNHLTDLTALDSLVKVSLNKPEMIAWLDVSFNEIEFVSDEILQLKNLKILYLHGNKIRFFIEVLKLKALQHLRNLTLHGNPIEENPNYRSMVVKNFPKLVNFDFSLVTRE